MIKLTDLGRSAPLAPGAVAPRAELQLETMPAERGPLVEVLGTMFVVASLLFVAAYL